MNNKVALKNEAISHFNLTKTRYKYQTEETVAKTVVMRLAETPIEQDNIDGLASRTNTSIVFKQADTVGAIFGSREGDGNITLLNFASFKNPGGGYINGAMAQEEALCAESNLYNVLLEFNGSFYEEHRKDANFGLYRTELLYSPDVVFTRSGYKKSCNVITCAAPNASAAMLHKEVSKQMVLDAMRERIDYILYAAAVHSNRKCLILGAFGCGVFGNSVEEVAGIFESLIQGKYKNVFEEIVFAVPEKDKLNTFKYVFGTQER